MFFKGFFRLNFDYCQIQPGVENPDGISHYYYSTLQQKEIVNKSFAFKVSQSWQNLENNFR